MLIFPFPVIVHFGFSPNVLTKSSFDFITLKNKCPITILSIILKRVSIFFINFKNSWLEASELSS